MVSIIQNLNTRKVMRWVYTEMFPITIRLKNDQLMGNFPLLLTKTQISRINKADKTGIDINISKTQISAQSKSGGFYWHACIFLARTVLPAVANKSGKVVPPIATGALSRLALTGVSKIFGNGLIISVPTPCKATRITQQGRALLNQCANQSNVEKQ